MPETPEQLYARAAGSLRMPPVEEWDTFPFPHREPRQIDEDDFRRDVEALRR